MNRLADRSGTPESICWCAVPGCDLETGMHPRAGVNRLGFCACCLVPALVLAITARAGAKDEPPRVVAVVVVDQFPRAYLDRFAPLFGKDGFRRLLDRGADYRQANHDHFVTTTAAGHAVILTGAYAVRNGIINNWWYSRSKRRVVTSVEDEHFALVGPEELMEAAATLPGASPLALAATTVGDVLRIETGMQARVLSVSIKDRTAILLGGQRPSGAYWFDPLTCSFISSSYYVDRLPDWVQRFNAAGPCTEYLGREWDRLRDDVDYTRFAGADDVPYEMDAYGLGRTFPHPIREWVEPGVEGRAAHRNRYAAVVGTPFGNDILLRFAEVAFDEVGLGRDAVPDLLTVSFSSNDYVGHMYGPQSQEVMDTALRTDRAVAGLMRFLDERVGAGRWTMVLTSDHGVAPAPEHLEQIGILPIREDHHRLDVDGARARVESAIAKRLAGTKPVAGGTVNFIEAWDAATHPFVYLNRQAAGHAGSATTFDDLISIVAEEIAALDGVARVYRRTELMALAGSKDPFEQRAFRSWHCDNGGDLLVALQPYWAPEGKRVAASHGSPYAYDTHVPLVLYGHSIRRGRVERRVELVDLASTLARVLRIAPPPLDQGRPLVEALE
jgi:predicted AlkP superfamily pyrophosphatase or phosphodiesterase